MKSLTSIAIHLDHIHEGLRLFIDARRPETLFDAGESAAENNEARYQLVEGCFYDYEFSDAGFRFDDAGEQIIQPHSRNRHIGTLSPNIYVGTLSLPVIKAGHDAAAHTLTLEVQSVKSGYRDDYRDMLAFITEKCTDLLLQANSPVSHYFEIDYAKDSQTRYQRFAFIKSVIGTDEFAEAIHRIVTAPVTTWTETAESSDVRQARRFSNGNVKELLQAGNRTRLPVNHHLHQYGLATLPDRITTIRKTDSPDTPENRFVKHALQTFLKFCTDIRSAAPKGSRLDKESLLLIRELEQQLHHTVFRDISRPTTLRLNSPVLQRKEGYREVLRVWLMFDLAARLIWTGGDDIYSGGKTDIATLYEYWLFFQLLDLVQSLFEMEPGDIADLIRETPDGLNLQLKQGKFTALSGIYSTAARKLHIRFNYNRSFSGKQSYPNPGSWTTTLRPDYTLTFWPAGIPESEAEKQELIVHIHFDAKYKVDNLADLIQTQSAHELDEEKTSHRRGLYKNADLLKMHAYRDAIRRSGGAYILYPGDQSIRQRGFHEIIPGLGAFPVRPSKTDSGIGELKAFLLEITDHFINRVSQREKLAHRIFDIYRNPPGDDHVVNAPLPEPYGVHRDLIPDETFVLVGFYHSPQQYEWICRNGLYNFRAGTGSGSLVLDKEVVSARYLLLHTTGDKTSGDLWKIVSNGPKVYAKQDLIRKQYPDPSQDHYLVIKIEKVTDPEFEGIEWDFRKLSRYSPGRKSAFPFSVSLVELMRVRGG